MDDLEITKRCAEVSEVWTEAHKWYPTMTLDPTFSGVEIRGEHCYLVPNNPMRQGPQVYDPLHDDAQAMALVRKFTLQLEYREPDWNVYWRADWFESEGGSAPKSVVAEDTDLSRAICLCVAAIPAPHGGTE